MTLLTYNALRMQPAEALALFRRLDACAPGLAWLAERIDVRPEATCLDLWREALAFDERCGGVPETHLGRSWCAWVARQAEIPCSTGVYSGRHTDHGASVDALDPPLVLAGLETRGKDDGT